MKKLFYFKIEPFMGYIPYDKVHINNIAFESGFKQKIITQELEDTWLKMRYGYKDEYKESFSHVVNTINAKIMLFMKGKEVLDDKQKQFYLNFNKDGIDCFVSRWNWKEKEL